MLPSTLACVSETLPHGAPFGSSARRRLLQLDSLRAVLQALLL